MNIFSFYYNQDETNYYAQTSSEDCWNHLVKQSEALWPNTLERIRTHEAAQKGFIIEGANLLPHLIARDTTLTGVYLLGRSFKEVLERLRAEPRWGETKELQQKEAEDLFFSQRPHYEAEAKQFGFQTFEDSSLAESTLRTLLQDKSN